MPQGLEAERLPTKEAREKYKLQQELTQFHKFLLRWSNSVAVKQVCKNTAVITTCDDGHCVPTFVIVVDD